MVVDSEAVSFVAHALEQEQSRRVVGETDGLLGCGNKDFFFSFSQSSNGYFELKPSQGFLGGRELSGPAVN